MQKLLLIFIIICRSQVTIMNKGQLRAHLVDSGIDDTIAAKLEGTNFNFNNF